jgi:enamine deaminase RidA (YjgF/YER057c/UK114 family)
MPEPRSCDPARDVISYAAAMNERQNISSGSPFEPVLGYCRAVRIGSTISVSGTGPARPDGTVDPDPEAQAARSLEIIIAALAEAGAAPTDVVRTRVYLTDAADFDAVARAHGAVFSDIRPANTTVVVAALLNPQWKVEIEADAILAH